MNIDTAAQLHIVPEDVVMPTRYRDDNENGRVSLQTNDEWVLRIYSKHQRAKTNFSLYFRNGILGSRQVFQGPIIHEDYGFLVANPTVISAHRGQVVHRHEANVGDLVVFAGHLWKIVEDKPLHDPYLVKVV